MRAGQARGPLTGLVVEVVRRLLEGKLTWWHLYLDLEAGNLRTVPPTPEAVSRLTGMRVSSLIAKKK